MQKNFDDKLGAWTREKNRKLISYSCVERKAEEGEKILEAANLNAVLILLITI